MLPIPNSRGRFILTALLIGLMSLIGIGAETGSKPLKIATHLAPPYVIQTDIGGWQGIVIDLWDEIAAELELDFVYEDVSVEEAVDGLENGRLDGAAMALTATAARERVIDFSHPFGSAGLAMAMKSDEAGSWLQLLRGLFSLPFLSAVLALCSVLFGAGVCVWLFERRHNPEQFGGKPHRGLGNSVWWSAVTMTTVGYGDLAPKTLGGRIVALIWMFTSVIIISSFTASIASSITTSNLVSERRKKQELTKLSVGTVAGTSSASYLQSIDGRAQTFPALDGAIDALLGKKVEAVVYDKPILVYLARETYGDSFEVLPGILQREDYAFAFPEGSPLREPVNEALLKRINDGRVAEIARRYLGSEY